MSSLVVTELVKCFDDVRAVDGVSLHVPEGSIAAVLGPSGCGKTTLLRTIAGFLVQDSGSISFGGRVVADDSITLAPQRRRVGYVPQEGALFPHLTVAQNISFGLPRSQRGGARVAEMLELVELPADHATRAPRELSGGQQQRVALPRALAPRPALVLLDEPFSSLDAALRTSTGRAVVRALQSAGTTAVLVTHDQDEALSLTDQVAVMRAGRVVQADTPRAIYQSPADADVARFVGGAVLLPRPVAMDMLEATNLVSGDKAARHVLVRPEQVHLHSSGEGPTGVVTEVSYYGHDASVRVRLDRHDADLVARVVGSAAPEVGVRVHLSVAGPVRAI